VVCGTCFASEDFFFLVIGVMEEQRVVYCQDLLMGQDERFWENIITGDETWCFAYDPATKRQSADWMGQDSPKPKKLRFQKSRVKTMLISFFRRRRCNSSRVCP